MMSASSLCRFFAVPDRDPLIKMFVKDVAMWWIDSPIVVLQEVPLNKAKSVSIKPDCIDVGDMNM